MADASVARGKKHNVTSSSDDSSHADSNRDDVPIKSSKGDTKNVLKAQGVTAGSSTTCTTTSTTKVMSSSAVTRNSNTATEAEARYYGSQR